MTQAVAAAHKMRLGSGERTPPTRRGRVKVSDGVIADGFRSPEKSKVERGM